MNKTDRKKKKKHKLKHFPHANTFIISFKNKYLSVMCTQKVLANQYMFKHILTQTLTIKEFGLLPLLHHSSVNSTPWFEGGKQWTAERGGVYYTNYSMGVLMLCNGQKAANIISQWRGDQLFTAYRWTETDRQTYNQSSLAWKWHCWQAGSDVFTTFNTNDGIGCKSTQRTWIMTVSAVFCDGIMETKTTE